jgi:hypothetical protein
MLETPIFRYYAFGYNYRGLRFSTEGRKVKGEPNSLEDTIRELFEFLDELDLPVTKNVAADLMKVQDSLKDLANDANVDGALAARVSEACEKLDATLDAELLLRKAFVVTPKRFDLKHLLEHPNSLVAKETDARLPALSKFDFGSACRCIAFALPTAAAFHLTRCVEGMLREYYRSIVKKGRVDPLLWHNMVTHLRARRDGPPKVVLDHLDNIRSNFRNPTQHPDARYDMEEAQDLLNVVVDALNRMSRDLASRKL